MKINEMKKLENAYQEAIKKQFKKSSKKFKKTIENFIKSKEVQNETI